MTTRTLTLDADGKWHEQRLVSEVTEREVRREIERLMYACDLKQWCHDDE